MDVDFEDTIEAELARRKAANVTTEPVKENKENETIEQIEDRARKAEREFEEAKLPERFAIFYPYKCILSW